MCGIAGFLGQVGIPDTEAAATLEQMGAALAHRGPDDQGIHWDPETRLGMVHRRLSIIDLSAAGHQPMRSACGRYLIAYNGELYNFLAIREELNALGYTFRGNSDTEVLLEAIAQWGLVDALSRFIGMFAFALWDERRRELTLGRDRLGIKPLFYQIDGRKCLFASELKALHRLPGWKPNVDRESLVEFVDRGYISAPATIYEGVRKLPPGTTVTYSLGNGSKEWEPTRFWSLGDAVDSWAQAGISDEHEALDVLHEKTRDAVKLRMVADVPLGAFLSGGIDSTLVVATMQQLVSEPVKTFTIGFEDGGYDEASHAARIAKHLGTDHTTRYVSEADVLRWVPKLSHAFDEPFADASQLPTLLLSSIAREQVTTVLSGDGGDESFAGYVRHFEADRIETMRRRLPQTARSALSSVIRSVPESSWDRLYGAGRVMVPSRFKTPLPGNKAHKLARVIGAHSPQEVYHLALGQWPGQTPVLGARRDISSNWWSWPERALTLTESYMYQDSLGYLHDDVLTKVDRSSMAVALEARVPLLDHNIVEFAWSLPVELKLKNGVPKYLLRRLLARLVPQALWDRPKMGFNVPIGRWLRVSLREWGEDLLAPGTIRRQGYLDPEAVSELWKRHQAGTDSSAQSLWNLVVFQQWLETYEDT